MGQGPSRFELPSGRIMCCSVNAEVVGDLSGFYSEHKLDPTHDDVEGEEDAQQRKSSCRRLSATSNASSRPATNSSSSTSSYGSSATGWEELFLDVSPDHHVVVVDFMELEDSAPSSWTAPVLKPSKLKVQGLLAADKDSDATTDAERRMEEVAAAAYKEAGELLAEIEVVPSFTYKAGKAKAPESCKPDKEELQKHCGSYFESVIEVGADEYWRLTRSRDFELYRATRVNFEDVIEVERADSGPLTFRHILNKSSLSLPAPIKKIAGPDCMSFEEYDWIDQRAREVLFHTFPNQNTQNGTTRYLTERVWIDGATQVVPHPENPGWCVQKIWLKAHVNVPFVGERFEKIVLKELENATLTQNDVIRAYKARTSPPVHPVAFHP